MVHVLFQQKISGFLESVLWSVFPPFRSLFSTDMAAITTTHAEEPWLQEAGWWQLLTVWKSNAIIISGCLSF